MRAQRAEGTRDLIGRDMRAWIAMRDAAAEVFEPFGFELAETPAIEQVDVFVHGIGQSTDVVRKEMFRVFSGANLERALTQGTEANLKAKQRLALRPEGTAGLVRAVVEGNLVPPGGAPVKLYYAEAMFRGERPQRGRLRQFHQIGIEWLGAPDAAADAESIVMLMEFYRRIGFDMNRLRLSINSMGDARCRPAYREKVRDFIARHADEMCDECRERAQLNPLRAFDCKNDRCSKIMRSAPLMIDNLCEECRAHHDQVKRYLDAAGVSYLEDPTLVRGLDYYTRTVFEVEALDAAVGSIGGGGRYDGLVELEGGKPTPGVGFAVGFERIMLALEAQGTRLGKDAPPCVYVANAGADLRERVFDIALQLRAAGVRTEADYQGRSLKGQFKQADRLKAALIIVIGAEELAAGAVRVRDMVSHEERLVALDEILEDVRSRLS
ncbi:histidyl-tRNA synthetase [Coriobacterium glomerans PW2]|uniref:Histidine--tRNA ligase n=1 Tax=Coriobacterium glomerans (strain ATCC 49209 / DSM 20642 / JCM 10262 / PW2) TaxID=700015 RepID=F2N8W9_CORGP|nr:histidine--tRNA ligase [Coriobacterium glomerans]AEB07569.1 histidyl-tRNA synthetase [Coriobacterium glomerans PW2]